MERNAVYTEQDCLSDSDIQGKVVVIKQDVPEKQLYFCHQVKETGSNLKGDTVFLVSLHTGEFVHKNRSEVIGVLKPELLPDRAKLHLSQINPAGAFDIENHEIKYCGYSFLPDGRYASGVWLCSEQEVLDYLEMQKFYQHRITVCNRNDICVMEMELGVLIYPTEAEIEDFRNSQAEACEQTSNHSDFYEDFGGINME